MTEKELWKKLEESAEEIKVPESLSPEAVRRRLEAESLKMEKEQRQKKKQWKKMVSVAALALVCIGGSAAVYSHWGGTQGTGTTQRQAAEMGEEKIPSDKIMEELGIENVSDSNAENTTNDKDFGNAVSDGPAADLVPKQDAGDLYVVAKDYGEVYDLLDTYRNGGAYEKFESAAEDAVEESVAGGAQTDGTFSTSISKDMATPNRVEGAVSDLAVSNSVENPAAGKENYSSTNLQMKGVDESDIIKTDGSYIYTVAGSRVVITDVQTDKMKPAGEIEISMNSASDAVLEMYVKGNTLNLIVQKENTNLKKGRLNTRGIDREENTTYRSVENSGVIPVEDVYYLNSSVETEVQTYDITDRSNPVLKGSVAQDGYYNTSRKIGDILYLFTEQTVNSPELTRGAAITEEGARGWIPLVDGKAVSADCIYIPQSGNDGLLISSINVNKPENIVDNTLILNNHVNIYVSSSAIYLYGQDYASANATTQIAKFTLKNGAVNAIGATNVKGYVNDTFAINEYQGRLRILTTDWSSSERENGLYLFDEKLNLTGKLEGIARGEEIYAARYLGNTAYFVTYRNTDPLFAADLTDAAHPKLLSELKITGFSEYLHFWGKDKLLGIGYETDPKSGARKGIKLTMFDISNPMQLKTAGTCVIENIDASPALYNYKCVLADDTENLIGFAAESYRMNYDRNSYLLFSWENGDFKNRMTEKLEEGILADEYRGIYIGDRFYLANRGSIRSYDRKDGYRMLEKLELK